MVNIKSLKKSDVLMTLWVHSVALGLGILQDSSTPPDTVKAIEHLRSRKMDLYFDYFKGRVIKCDITGAEFDPRLYDRDLGVGAAQNAINKLTEEKND